MALITTTRAVYHASQETTLKRDVDESMLKLEPDAAPLWVLTNKANKRAPSIAPKFEWFEDAEAPLWGQVNNGTTNYASNATQILVVDGTIFAVDDLVIVPKATVREGEALPRNLESSACARFGGVQIPSSARRLGSRLFVCLARTTVRTPRLGQCLQIGAA